MSRLSTDNALRLWRDASDAELQELASAARARFHPPDECTYLIMRIVNYTNVCVAQCDYCAFYRLPGQAGGYVLSRDQVFAKLDELLALGGDLAGFNGGFNPHLPLDYYCELFAAIRERYQDRLRRLGDPRRILSCAPQQIQVHRRGVLRRPARPGRGRPENHRHDGHRL